MINGTYNILDEVNWEEPKSITVKKQIWNPEKQQFEPRVFIRWRRQSTTELEQDIKFLTKHYGEPSRQGIWWPDDRGQQKYLWVSEAAATFWLLKYG